MSWSSEHREFNPDWTIHPGETLRKVIRVQGLTQRYVAEQVGISQKYLSEIVNGHALYSARLAVSFARLLGSSPQFWWNLRCNYELDLALGRKVMH